ncbi:MAG: hypothetical protein ACRYE7_02525 [Janthinobacterium lividum]
MNTSRSAPHPVDYRIVSFKALDELLNIFMWIKNKIRGKNCLHKVNICSIVLH